MRKIDSGLEVELYNEFVRKYSPKGGSKPVFIKKMVPRLRTKLIQKAYERFGKIKPAGRAKSFHDSFTFDFGILFFWYNTADGSTHVEQSVL